MMMRITAVIRVQVMHFDICIVGVIVLPCRSSKSHNSQSYASISTASTMPPVWKASNKKTVLALKQIHQMDDKLIIEAKKVCIILSIQFCMNVTCKTLDTNNTTNFNNPVSVYCYVIRICVCVLIIKGSS